MSKRGVVIRRVDGNQAEIVRGLRDAGCTVTSLHIIGSGCPDLLVGARFETYLIEVKMPGEKLTPDEAAWHREWRGMPVIVAHSVDEALVACGLA